MSSRKAVNGPSLTRYLTIWLLGCCLNSVGQTSKQADFNASYVRVSQANPAYFELSNKQPYIPVGANLCWAKDMPTLESYFRKTAENGGNYARIWLSHPLFEIENPGWKGNKRRRSGAN